MNILLLWIFLRQHDTKNDIEGIININKIHKIKWEFVDSNKESIFGMLCKNNRNSKKNFYSISLNFLLGVT